MKLKIKKLIQTAVLPQKAHDTDAGFDLFSVEKTVIKPGDRKPIHTGIAMAIPIGKVGLLWSRSGLAFNYGIDTKAGCIDSGYRGEVVVLLENNGNRPVTINPGDKITQMILVDISSVDTVVVDDLNESDRGENGFGSTDKKESEPKAEKPKAKKKPKQKKPKQKD